MEQLELCAKLKFWEFDSLEFYRIILEEES